MLKRPDKPLAEYMKLYLVLESGGLCLPMGDFIMQAVEGGVTAIQLRDKEQNAKTRYETAKSLALLLDGRDVLFIVNNSPDIALAVGAHGVHLGVTDMPISAVHQKFPELIAGYSCNNNEDVTAANAHAHYAGIGPVFETPTKSDARPVIGVEGMQRIAGLVEMPAVAIGGINLENAAKLTGCLNTGIAVSSALCRSDAPYDMAKALRCIVEAE